MDRREAHSRALAHARLLRARAALLESFLEHVGPDGITPDLFVAFEKHIGQLLDLNASHADDAEGVVTLAPYLRLMALYEDQL